jgi:hypothetical protein
MTTETQNTNPKTTKSRRWFRFSLRTLLVMVTVMSVVLGWAAWELEQRRREKVAIAWVVEMGGDADFFFNDGDQRNWWEKTKDRWFGDRIRDVSIYHRQRIDLSPLAEMEKLECLYLTLGQMSDLSPLAELKNLEVLWLFGNRFLDDTAQVYDVSPLAELKNLEVLWLTDTPVNDLSPLAELKNIIIVH